ncbi:PilZ domain-containing protein [Geomonas sp. RF6]|uniref:PilZ domain-containing protein n=1 Tax=Geomonas sp. RF6 TaxID=2897342 RepID=UPI001E5DD0B5|nr:PilZ domain-containing protein [Geomonas sp. RF6]UFS72029.1 PilZ domain-containing protein [Geomonas sp. RF6]
MEKILLVSSDQAFLERNRNLFSKSGFSVHTATTAQEGLLIHQEHRTNLIIANLNLPDLEIERLCSIIRNDTTLRNVSIIVICFPTEKALRRAAGSGANAWLTRPVDPNVLLECATRFLRIAERRAHRVPFTGHLYGRRGSEIFSGTSCNISVSGLLCETEALLEEDDLVTIRYRVGADSIETKGKVVRSVQTQEGGYSYGVEFLDLAADQREGIQKFVEAAGQ